jgi:magnesium chelatase subunit D
MKLALLLAAVDWRLGVLLRGDKGSGKTTTARAFAALLPAPAPFVNLPIGATEDRLLGGLHLERTLKGDPVLKPGLIAEAHGGVLYIDEINLLPAHLGDALLDTAASGVHVVEREGLSATHPAAFVLLGSMNPEEGSLRPQLLDRFALSVNVHAPLEPSERHQVTLRRIAFERNPTDFIAEWTEAQQELQSQIVAARVQLGDVVCADEMMQQISTTVCDYGIRSMRADLAVVRAALAYAALCGESHVRSHHVEAVLPLALSHRTADKKRSSQAPPPPSPPAPQPQSPRDGAQPQDLPPVAQAAQERVFAPINMQAPMLDIHLARANSKPGNTTAEASDQGPITGARKSSTPFELDIRATLNHTLLETGSLQPRVSDLHERIRTPRTGTRFLFVIDSSGSHAAQQRMRMVKGAISGLLHRSFKQHDEVCLIVFRGVSAQTVLEPTKSLADAIETLEYLPTGGRTPLASALQHAQTYLTSSTILILITDGHANIAVGDGDPWQEALHAARQIHTSAILVDTDSDARQQGSCAELAAVLNAQHLSLDDLATLDSVAVYLKSNPALS